MRYCARHKEANRGTITEALLKSAAEPQFAEVWRLWAQQDPAVPGELLGFLYVRDVNGDGRPDIIAASFRMSSRSLVHGLRPLTSTSRSATRS